MNNAKKTDEFSVKVRVPPGKETPLYANFTVIDWKRDEMILNFCHAEGDARLPSATLVQKLVMHPREALRLMQLLQDILDAYQERHGVLEPSVFARGGKRLD